MGKDNPGVQVPILLPYLIAEIQYYVKGNFSDPMEGQKHVEETYDSSSFPRLPLSASPVVCAPEGEGSEESESEAEEEDKRWGVEEEKKGDEGRPSPDSTQ